LATAARLLNKSIRQASLQQRTIWKARLPTRECQDAMCDKCTELDKRIEKYQRMAATILDQVTIERMQAAVQRLEAETKALHPERP
jgi:hypothetical protein